MSDAHGIARDQLRAFIERIERLEEEKKSIADDIKDVYGEAKSMGFDSKILRKVISIRKQDADERAEQEAILDTYLHALGMIDQPSFFDDEPRQSTPVDRKARAALRTSEAMDDNKAFSAQLLADGLISEEAHAENIALSDAVAMKLGAGVIDPETGEILDDQPRSDGGLNIVTKHSEIATASQGGTASPSPDAELSSAGANTGGEDVDRSAERADINAVASASGPDEKRATDLNANDDTAVDAISDVHGGAGSGMARTEASAVTAGETAPIPNERCLNPAGCNFSHHPNKIACSPCGQAWFKRREAERAA
ncbi:DUF2312 domain-containing protein [Sinorhizobium meliloti]|nr:DUF2312 domain-containing protein [Sinorhizobium meliloti]RVK97512.1 DUF2312 domain-containing protein [Sinorhizobium meliloti]RVO35018.1 DUF2312 domain-containing protein [Sinorhizobium meliloti]